MVKTPIDQRSFPDQIADQIRTRETKIRAIVRLILLSKPSEYQTILSAIQDLSLRRAVEAYGLLELQRGAYFAQG